MERITYRITLDTHRTGIQRTLQGFETADKMARRISVNLVASGDTFEVPMTNVVAMMYVTTPNATEPSVNACSINGNAIIYDVEPITEEGITEMQLKVMETSAGGAKNVLVSPRFAVEVTKSNTDDEGAEQSATFTALEEAIAKADAVYGSRLLRVVIEEDFVFRAYYADGTVYENTYFVNVIKNGASMLAQSYAVGGVGVREGEDTDNAKYYSNVSRSASEDANKMYDESHELLDESRLYTSYTYFNVNFETGELGYISVNCDFKVNQETGNLDTDKDDAYSVDDIIKSDVERFINEKSAEINNHLNTVETIAKGATQALSYKTYKEMVESLKKMEAANLNVGQNIYIGTVDVPDVWVYSVVADWVDYSYIDEQTFAEDFDNLGVIQVGYYVLLPLETEKVDLTDYAKKTEVNDAIKQLRGDDSTRTLADAFAFAGTMLPMDKLVVIEGTAEFSIGPYSDSQTTHTITLPSYAEENFDNMVLLSCMVGTYEGVGFTTGRLYSDDSSAVNRAIHVCMEHKSLGSLNNYMYIMFYNLEEGEYSIPYKIVLYDYSNSVG